MPNDCWVDLYESPRCAGERRRVAGPVVLDEVVWRRFAAGDQVSLHVGPRARIRLRTRGEDDRDVGPSGDIVGVRALEIVEVRIERAAGETAPSEETRAEPARPRRRAVHRSLGGPAPRTSDRAGDANAVGADAAEGVEN